MLTIAAVGTTPTAEQVREYASKNLQPTLVKALTELAKAKPEDPLVWLGDWLLTHNPNKPQVSVQLP